MDDITNEVQEESKSLKLVIKDEYLDIRIKCPFTGSLIFCRFIQESLYQYYYPHYKFIFE